MNSFKNIMVLGRAARAFDYQCLEERIDRANEEEVFRLCNAMLYRWIIPLNPSDVPAWYKQALYTSVAQESFSQTATPRSSIMGAYTVLAERIRSGLFDKETRDAIVLLDICMRGIISLLLVREQTPSHTEDVCTLIPLMDQLLLKIDRSPPGDDEVGDEMMFYMKHFKNSENVE